MGKTKRSALLSTAEETIQTVAIYARVSTEDQAERATIQNQLDFLRRFVDLHSLPVAGEYVDDGVSGTVPLDDRPGGQRLLIDAQAGHFGAVLVYRIDRLGRSLRSLLTAHDALNGCGVAIRSATEPFDSGTPIGAFLFQLLGSLAELEKSTIAERTGLGRNRVAIAGGYTGGPIPLGYDLNEDNRIVPSQRLMPELGMTESEFVRDLFARIASREITLNSECGRLTALGVPHGRRYGGKDERGSKHVRGWALSSLATILHNPIYKGDARLASSFGTVERSIEPLVDAETWDLAHVAMQKNRDLSIRESKHVYLLRGLVRCQNCGRHYVGAARRGVRFYRCNSGNCRATGGNTDPCPGKMLKADWIEAAVWDECRRFILNPGEALHEARARLREKMSKATSFEDVTRKTQQQLDSKDAERERVLTLYRRGRISEVEAERELDAVAKEAAQLREIIESQRAQSALIDAQEAYLTESTLLLTRLQGELATIEATNDMQRKREIMQRYVRAIHVETRGTKRWHKECDVRIYLRLKPEPVSVDNVTSSRSGDYGPTLEVERLVLAS